MPGILRLRRAGHGFRLLFRSRSAKAILASRSLPACTTGRISRFRTSASQQAGGKWSSVYVGARPAVFGIVSSYHIGYLNFRNFAQANDFICALHEVLLPASSGASPAARKTPRCCAAPPSIRFWNPYLRHTLPSSCWNTKPRTPTTTARSSFSQDKRYCYFNTGLLTRYAQDLYLTGEVSGLREDGIFTCNNPKFVDSKITLVKTYGFAQRDIDPGPGTASFYRKVSDIVYDPTLTIDFTQSKLEHIIDDGIRRGRIPRKYTVTQSGQPVPVLVSGADAPQQHQDRLHARPARLQIRRAAVSPPPEWEYVGGKRICYEGQIQFLMPIYLSADYISSGFLRWCSPAATAFTSRRPSCCCPGRTPTRASSASRTTAGSTQRHQRGGSAHRRGR